MREITNMKFFLPDEIGVQRHKVFQGEYWAFGKGDEWI